MWTNRGSSISCYVTRVQHPIAYEQPDVYKLHEEDHQLHLLMKVELDPPTEPSVSACVETPVRRGTGLIPAGRGQPAHGEHLSPSPWGGRPPGTDPWRLTTCTAQCGRVYPDTAGQQGAEPTCSSGVDSGLLLRSAGRPSALRPSALRPLAAERWWSERRRLGGGGEGAAPPGDTGDTGDVTGALTGREDRLSGGEARAAGGGGGVRRGPEQVELCLLFIVTSTFQKRNLEPKARKVLGVVAISVDVSLRTHITGLGLSEQAPSWKSFSREDNVVQEDPALPEEGVMLYTHLPQLLGCLVVR
ncbi:hypothetical protein EYF80_062256 [Liparis tanakae]|uniref:Uncharacterized protein n=1 Tax=Liparis tanakae TaxID=230148 RepID=A0A4Z2EFD0_9TELE|nr:hypothetical protein EYF80_062256 [Liparis tanakae]